MDESRDYLIRTLLARAQVAFENMDPNLREMESKVRYLRKRQAQGLAAVAEVRRLLGYDQT